MPLYTIVISDLLTICFSFQAFLSLARFADTQYQKKVDYMSSSTYENKESLMKKAKVTNYSYQISFTFCSNSRVHVGLLTPLVCRKKSRSTMQRNPNFPCEHFLFCFQCVIISYFNRSSHINQTLVGDSEKFIFLSNLTSAEY